jgi:hypothetical protein
LLRGPFSWTLRDSDSKEWGLELLFPATIGFHDYTDGEDNVGTITFVPGVQFIYPVLENWWLKPFGQVGVGKDFSGSDVAVIWGGGIKSLAKFSVQDFELELGNALTYAAQNQSDGGSDNGFSMFDIGLNSRWPTNLSIRNKKTNLNVFFVYTQFINDLDFSRVDEDDLHIHRLYKVGMSFEVEGSLSILGFGLRGLGLDVTYGKNYAGVGLTTGFPF